MNLEAPKNDVPAGVAVAMLIVVVGAWCYFQAPAAALSVFMELDRYSEKHLMALSVLLVLSTINVVWVVSVFSRLFSVNRQGKRLEILTQHKNRALSTAVAWRSILAGMAGSGVFYLFLRFLPVEIPLFVGPHFERLLHLCVSFNLGFCLFVVSSLIERANVFAKLFSRNGALPELPIVKNGLVLGAEEV